MLTENRKYNFVGELILNRSHVLYEQSQPKDDKVNWLFIKIENQQFSFVYKIENPIDARYGKSFKVKLAFTMIETIREIIQLHHSYDVFRGQEYVGALSILDILE